MTNLLYNAFVELTGTRPAWGMLTGIHPVKLLRQYVEEQGEEAGAVYFQSHCHVTAPKAELARRVLRAQAPAVEAPDGKRFQPVCVHPFLSHPVRVLLLCLPGYGAREKLMDPYFDLLLVELEKDRSGDSGPGPLPDFRVHRRGAPHHLVRPAASALCGKIRHVLISPAARVHRGGRPPGHHHREKLLALREAGINPSVSIPSPCRTRCCATSAAATPPRHCGSFSSWPSSWALTTSTPT